MGSTYISMCMLFEILKICFFTLLSLINSMNYISMDSCIFTLYFGLQYNYVILFKLFQILAVENSFNWFPCPFDMSLSFCFLNISLLSGTARSSFLVFSIPRPPPRPRISHFFKTPALFYFNF